MKAFAGLYILLALFLIAPVYSAHAQATQTLEIRSLTYQLEKALQRLQSKQNSFVIVENSNTKKFVQFTLSSPNQILMDIPSQTMSAEENERAAYFFEKQGIDAYHESSMINPETFENIGTQKSFELLIAKPKRAADLATSFFKNVYGNAPGSSYTIIEE